MCRILWRSIGTFWASHSDHSPIFCKGFILRFEQRFLFGFVIVWMFAWKILEMKIISYFESFKRRHISVRALASSYSCIAMATGGLPPCCQSTRLGLSASLEYPLYVLYLLCPLWNIHESYEHSVLLSGFACYDVSSLVVNATIFQNASPWDRGGWRVAPMGSNKNNYGHPRCSDPQSQPSR